MHVPVLLKETIDILNPQPNEDAIDATVDGGGHAEAILGKTAPRGKLLGIDRDPSMIPAAKKRLLPFGDRAIVRRGNFSNIAIIAGDIGVLHPSLVLFDLGISSYHLASEGRGFSFQRDEALDMRYDQEEDSLTAEAIVNHADAAELEKIFKIYGEERSARRIAEAITRERKHRHLETTKELAELVERVVGRRGRIHPATKIFQALRIAVNSELDHLTQGLEDAYRILNHGGRLAVISFHSLEDRIVKNFFRERKDGAEILTPKPVVASIEERRQNPRARSAKLRILKKHI